MKTGVLAVTVLAVACVAQSSTEQKTADVQAICQQTLNLEALDRHFHGLRSGIVSRRRRVQFVPCRSSCEVAVSGRLRNRHAFTRTS
jgi:hypothetical protein